MWISPEFGVEVAEWVYRFISGDLTLVHDLVERHETVNVGTRVFTIAGADISREAHERLVHLGWHSRTYSCRIRLSTSNVIRDKSSFRKNERDRRLPDAGVQEP
jgi:hypothetical protein